MNTLGLHMIVGGGEAAALERCLQSVRGPLFDQIVVTCTTEDPEVRAVAEKYATQVPYFPWIKDFSAARNFSLDHLTTDWLFWLDADDIITDRNYNALLNLKKNLGKVDVYRLTYNYRHDENGNPSQPLPRERIVRRLPQYRWKWPIHEAMTVTGAPYEDHLHIAVDHYRDETKGQSARNLEILEKEFEKPDCDSRMKFYYAKELVQSGNWDKGGPLCEHLLKSGQIWVPDEAAILCRDLVFKYYWGGDYAKAREWCEYALTLNKRYAEFYCVLGILAHDQKREDEAIAHFEMAMACSPMDTQQGALAEYYKLIPAQNLYVIHHIRGQIEKALMYNKQALEANPTAEVYLADRAILWREYESRAQTKPAPVEPDVAFLVPVVDLDNPSIRIRRYNVCKGLQEAGVKARLIFDYYGQAIEKTLQEIGSANVCVFTQFGEYDYALMQKVKALGKRIAYDHCENIGPFPFQYECFALADALVCCSNKLTEISIEQGFGNAVTIYDSVEIGV